MLLLSKKVSNGRDYSTSSLVSYVISPATLSVKCTDTLSNSQNKAPISWLNDDCQLHKSSSNYYKVVFNTLNVMPNVSDEQLYTFFAAHKMSHSGFAQCRS